MAGFLTFILGLVYAIILILIIRRYSIKYMPTGSNTGGKKQTFRLANTLRIGLKYYFILVVFSTILDPFLFYIYPVIYHFFDPTNFYDMNKIFVPNYINFYFYLDLSKLSEIKITGLVQESLLGKVSLIMPQNNIIWYVYQIMDWVRKLYNCYIILQLCNIFTSICNGDAFTGVITRGLKKLGILIILWNLASAVIKHYGQKLILKDISVNTKALKLSPYDDLDSFLYGVFIGIALLVLAGIINEAIKIHEEQRLTI
jgi:hypothetical protein